MTRIEGDCPVCGVGPNSQLAYEDPANPFRVTEEIDGRGHVTRFTYDANGQPTQRLEAFGTALERETAWTYDPSFPAFVETTTQPSTSGFPNLKTTTNAYNASGDLTGRTVDGFEDDLAFSLTTAYGHNASGQVTSIDPPGYGTDDETTSTYDPARGNGFLVLDTRTDPLVGTTTFDHDAFNRRTHVTDPNGVVTETQYDALDRVTFVIQRGAMPAGDLVTEHRYDVFGDLFQTVLPEGNVVEYGYDAAGRLTSVERMPDDMAASHLERVVYTLDGFGNRVLEEHERWTGADWEKRSQTAYQYSNRCQLDQTIQGFGGEEATTEYDYDCVGNLERVWDANRPSMSQTEPASTVYSYDELDRLTEVRQPWGLEPLVLPAPDADESDSLAALFERLSAGERLSSVTLLPSLLVPSSLSVAKLREAAARFQADLLFIYRTPCQQYHRNRLLAADEAKAYCIAEGALLDVRTGIIPFSAVGTSTFSAVQGPEDLTSYETLRRSQSQAITHPAV